MPYDILQGGFFNNTLRTWQSRTSTINTDCLMYPIFISPQKDCFDEISSLPGQYRVGVNQLKKLLEPALKNGLKTVLLFASMNAGEIEKDANGSSALHSESNPVIPAVKFLKEHMPSLTVACDVCLCGYTNHGHCGVLDEDGLKLDNKKSVKMIVDVAKAYVQAGCDIIAPSDMNDGRIKALDDFLKEGNHRNKISIMSYSAKFSSCLYGPFRDAVGGSGPKIGEKDRKSYQLPPGSSGLAIRAVDRDVNESADILMVKPAMFYLDVIKEIKMKYPHHPLAAYQVSGEYAMIYHASKSGALDLKEAVLESLVSLHRAGTDILITYYTPLVLQWMSEER